MQTVNKTGVVHNSGFIDFVALFIGEKYLIGFNLNFADVTFFGHGHKSSVVNFFYLLFGKPRHYKKVEQGQSDKRHRIIIYQRLFRGFYFFHCGSSDLSLYVYSIIAYLSEIAIICRNVLQKINLFGGQKSRITKGNVAFFNSFAADSNRPLLANGKTQCYNENKGGE